MLVPRRPTRWYISLAALAWTITDTNLYGSQPFGPLTVAAVSVATVLAILAVSAQLRLARPVSAIAGALTLALFARPLLEWLFSPWPAIDEGPQRAWWRYDAVSWHAMQAFNRFSGAITLAAPIIAAAVLRGGRSTRDVLTEIRRSNAPDTT
jgi:hypothetical protein